MSKVIKTRFAPSPTGFMHIGNLRTALYAYLLAKSNNGKFIVRIEDTDQERLIEGAIDVILETLEMTHLNYDEGPIIGGSYGPYIQSERIRIYQKYALELVEKGAAYYCFCTKERLENSYDENGRGGYDRHCRHLSPLDIEANLRKNIPYVIRQKIPLSGITSYYDEVFGSIVVDNKELQDQVLLKTDGYPTYNFAHVVDDYLMGITHVVRGSEYVASTPKYVLLYDSFGWRRPIYVHLPLLMGKNADGSISKLSKRHGAVSFQDLIRGGFLAEAIINYIAFLGWNPKDSTKELYTLDELTQDFSIESINKSPSIFDYEKLMWFNSHYIKNLSKEQFDDKALPILKALCPEYIMFEKATDLLHTRISTFNEIVPQIQFIIERFDFNHKLYLNARNKTTPESCLKILEEIYPKLQTVTNWNNNTLFDILKEYAKESTQKTGAIMWAVRIAIARQEVSPGGATELMEVFRKEESLSRINQTIKEIRYGL